MLKLKYATDTDALSLIRLMHKQIFQMHNLKIKFHVQFEISFVFTCVFVYTCEYKYECVSKPNQRM